MNQPATIGSPTAPHRQQELYWRQLVELRVAANYVRLYRDDQASWINRVGIFRAIATSSTIAGWVIWKDYAFVWAIVLAISQLADATKDYLPNAKRQRAASELTVLLESLFIDARFEWEAISSGSMTNDDIMAGFRRLARLQLEAEQKHFPDGLPSNPRMRMLAEQEASTYVEKNSG